MRHNLIISMAHLNCKHTCAAVSLCPVLLSVQLSIVLFLSPSPLFLSSTVSIHHWKNKHNTDSAFMPTATVTDVIITCSSTYVSGVYHEFRLLTIITAWTWIHGISFVKPVGELSGLRLLLTHSLLDSLSWSSTLSFSNWLRRSLRSETSSPPSVTVPTETTASVAMVSPRMSVGVVWTSWSNRPLLFADWACLLLSSSLW